MNKITVYSLKGKEVGQANVARELLADANAKLLAQALHVYHDRQHPGHISYTKTRAEVDITKKKIYRQKGTGGARHGAKSAPIFVGGGTAHGPKGVKRELVLPQAMRKKASQVAMQYKTNATEVVAIDGLGEVNKTAQVKDVIKAIRSKKNQKLTFIVNEYKPEVFRALRNIANAQVLEKREINAYDIYFGGKILLDSTLTQRSEAKKAVNAKKKVTKK